MGLRTNLFRKKVARMHKHGLLKAANVQEPHSMDEYIDLMLHHHEPTVQERTLEQLREALDITHYSNLELPGNDLPQKTLDLVKQMTFNMIGADHPITPEPLKEELDAEFIIPDETQVTDTT